MIYLFEKDGQIEIGKETDGVLEEKRRFICHDTKSILQSLLDFGSLIKDNKISNEDKFSLFGNKNFFCIGNDKYILEKYFNEKQNLFNRSGFLKESLYDMKIYRLKTIEELLEFKKEINKKEFKPIEILQFYYDAKRLCENLLPLHIKNEDSLDLYYKASRLFYDLKILAANKGVEVPIRILEKAFPKAILPRQIKILKNTINNYEKLILNTKNLTILNYTENKNLISLVYGEGTK